MAFIPVPNVIEVEMLFRKAGQKMEMTFHVEVDVTIDAALFSAISQIFSDWWDSNYRGRTVSALAYVGNKLTDLTTSSAPSAILSYAGATPTGAGSGAMADNVTAAITKATDSRGRSFRGRNFLPGLDSGNFVDPDHLSAASILGLLSDWNDLHSALNAEDYVPVIVSRFHDLAPRVTGVATPITTLRMDDIADSQRRRLPGRGD